jgi:hypothetical protein
MIGRRAVSRERAGHHGTTLGTTVGSAAWRSDAHLRGVSQSSSPLHDGRPSLIMPGSRVRVPPLL